MIFGTTDRFFQRKEIALMPLVAKLTAQKEIRPLISQPIIAWLTQIVTSLLPIAAFRTEMFNIAIADM